MSHIDPRPLQPAMDWTSRPLRRPDRAVDRPAWNGEGFCAARVIATARPWRMAMRDLSLGLLLAMAAVEVALALLT